MMAGLYDVDVFRVEEGIRAVYQGSGPTIAGFGVTVTCGIIPVRPTGFPELRI